MLNYISHRLWNITDNCCTDDRERKRRCKLFKHLKYLFIDYFITLNIWLLYSKNFIQLFFLNSFIDIKLIYNKLHIFEVHDLRSFDISVHLWTHHHNQDNEIHTHFPQTLSLRLSNPSFLILFPILGNCWSAYCHYWLILSLYIYNFI